MKSETKNHKSTQLRIGPITKQVYLCFPRRIGGDIELEPGDRVILYAQDAKGTSKEKEKYIAEFEGHINKLAEKQPKVFFAEKEAWTCLPLNKLEAHQATSHCCSSNIRKLCDEDGLCVATMEAGLAWFRRDEVMDKLSGEQRELTDEEAVEQQRAEAKDDYEHCRKISVIYEEVRG